MVLIHWWVLRGLERRWTLHVFWLDVQQHRVMACLCVLCCFAAADIGIAAEPLQCFTATLDSPGQQDNTFITRAGQAPTGICGTINVQTTPLLCNLLAPTGLSIQPLPLPPPPPPAPPAPPPPRSHIYITATVYIRLMSPPLLTWRMACRSPV